MKFYGSFTPSDSVTFTITKYSVDWQNGCVVTVPVKEIKGAAAQSYGDGDGVVRCEQTFKVY